MVIGERLREIREEKKLSQGDIESRSGLLRCYISRVENGHTIPALETLEKLARAMELPLYQLLYDGEEPPKQAIPGTVGPSGEVLWGGTGKDARFLRKLLQAMARMKEREKKLLLFAIEKMAKKPKRVQKVSAEARA